MKLSMLSAFACLLNSTAFAQTSTSTPPSAAGVGTQPTQSITLSGCVGGGTNSQPYVLNNAMVLPQTGAATGGAGTGMTGAGATGTTGVGATGATGVGATPAATPPPTAGTTGAPGTPSGATGATGAAAPPGTGTTGVGTAGTAGTSGTTGATGVPGTAGVPPTASTGSPGTAGATGTAAAAGSPMSGGSAMSGYRLSGTDMSGWTGQRVQVVGTVVPSATAGTPTPGTVPVPEFRVQSVQPLPGACPQP